MEKEGNTSGIIGIVNQYITIETAGSEYQGSAITLIGLERQSNTSEMTGYGLKWIAVTTMFIDHTGAIYLWRLLEYSTNSVVRDNWEMLRNFYYLLRTIGRMAFPIYCFLLVEGYLHTRNVWEYARNLLFFGVISEIPFDLGFNRTLLEYKSNNVFWTLLLGLLMMIGLGTIREKVIIVKKNRGISSIQYFLKACGYMSIVMTAMLLASEIFCCDYGAGGIAAIAALYFLREHKEYGFFLAIIFLVLLAGRIELVAMSMLIPIYHYNGRRGKMPGYMKYIFYWFYPVHLLFLVFICVVTGLPVIRS